MSDTPTRAAHPALRGCLGDYVGYDFSGLPPGTHLGLPSGALTFIVAIDDPLCQRDPASHADSRFDVLLAGLHLRPTLVRHPGAMAGVQINLSPFAPRAFFGLTAADLTDHSVDLREITRPLATELHDRVNAAATWRERFAVIDDVLLRALRTRPSHVDANPRDQVVRAWSEIVGSAGQVPVTQLAEEVGWSRRHLSAQLRAEVGIGPKDASRVVRFDRARRLVAAVLSVSAGDPSDGGEAAAHHRGGGAAATTPPHTLAEVAAVCGYADQSHLIREFTAFTGTSPTSWLRADPVAAGN